MRAVDSAGTKSPMPTIAYIANELPNEVEWYVGDEIRELRRRGCAVIPCSAKSPDPAAVPQRDRDLKFESLQLLPMRLGEVVAATVLCIRRAALLWDLCKRVILGREPLRRRLAALAHTILGAAYARRLTHQRVDHIHAHHGYYASWVAMVAARLLGIPFSLTLHGSDLLVNGSYLDIKLMNCEFCRTISKFNREYILKAFPSVPPGKILMHHLGVDLPPATVTAVREVKNQEPLRIVSIGRLHQVKNHRFLVQACSLLRDIGVALECWIVGDGPERGALSHLISELHVEDNVRLVGRVPREQAGRFCELADLVVLTSHSEGIPLVLMEAMARARVVLAPAITGIPELVVDGKTGFLYPPGDLEGFVWRVDQIGRSLNALGYLRREAREHVRRHFERQWNLERFSSAFLEQISRNKAVVKYEDPVLQQI